MGGGPTTWPRSGARTVAFACLPGGVMTRAALTCLVCAAGAGWVSGSGAGLAGDRAAVTAAAAPVLLACGGPRRPSSRLMEAESPEIRFQGDPTLPAFGTVVVTGLDRDALAGLAARRPDAAAWSALLSVHTREVASAGEDLPPVLGDWSIDGEAIRFTPRFPLATGLRFVARFDGARFDALARRDGGAATPSLEITFSMPDPGLEPTTRVTSVHPSGAIVPENLLRLYVHFSAPMREQPVAGMVRLVDERGDEVTPAFVDVPRGLWDPEHRRLTLLFHPGRIKRGVGPHETMGPPLREGGTYRVEVSAGLLDRQGLPLREGFEKVYRAGAADRASPDPASWRLTPPADALSALVLDLPEPMDHALMLRLLTVETGRGEAVRGESRLLDGETRWVFIPDRPWEPGAHAVTVHPSLEDLAGNTAFRLFDQEGPRESHGRRDPAPIRIAFTVERGG